MSSDLYVKSLSRGVMRVQRRGHVAGSVMICFTDPNIKPIYLDDDSIVDIIDGKTITAYAVQRSNIRTLIARRFIQVVL